MKHICRNCHFLARVTTQLVSPPLIYSLSDNEREDARQGYVDFVDKTDGLNCHMGVWDEGLNPGKDQRLERVNNLNRKDKCFFFPHDPSMLFGAAKELQKREQENQQLKKSNMYTMIALWIAALALLVNAVIGVLELTE